STSIGRIDRDAFGHSLPASTRLQMWRLRKWQIRSRVHSSIDRNLTQAMAELDRLCDKTFTPTPVKERAAMIYRKALEKGLVRGRSIAAIAAAALYAACRATGTPKTLREIAMASLANKKDVARCYRLLLRELNIKMPIADPLIYIPKIAEKAEISAETQRQAVKIIEMAKKKRAVSGKDPLGIAAAALYIACILNDEKKTQKEIAQSANVTEVTIRNRYKSLKKVLDLDLPD
ncbi:MAG TPA: transcription initiation factor IIB, partial [Candidatus Bathyarchaeota archaeon]|nr:transcription initiation factor IIB [Candidatus Bathyarchaeota archaeon]